jgi:hypothetical protein
MKAKNIIILIVIILLFGILLFLGARSRFIPDNAPGTVGNTAGNLNNEGLFCEDEGMVYFANPYDNWQLYSMTPDGSNIKEVWDVPVRYINAAGKFLYYYQDADSANKGFGYLGNMFGIYRIKKDGTNNKSLDKIPSGILKLIDNSLYYQHFDNTEGMSLYQMNLDGSKKTMAIEAIVNPACSIDSVIYYANTEEGFILSAYDTQLKRIDTIYEGKLYNPIYQDSYMYYMNVADDYALYRYDMNDGSIEKLTADRVDTYNICNDYIYYQKNDAAEPALMRMRPDGSEVEIVAEGNYSNINITSVYTYFTAFDEDTPMYKTPTSGNINVTEFSEAAAAIVIDED